MKTSFGRIGAYLAFLSLALLLGYGLHSIGDTLNTLRAVTPETLVRPHFLLDTDDCQWQMTVEQALKSGRFRIKTNPDDNFPLGAAMHWPSPFLWMLMCGANISMLLGAPLAEAVYLGGSWVNPCIVMFFVASFGWAVIRRFGVLGAGFLCFGLLATFRGSYDFIGIRTDHHGLIHSVLSVFVVSSCLLLSRVTRATLLTSAMSAAIAVWLGPMNAIPIICALGLAAALVWIVKPPELDASNNWMIWGFIAGGAAFAFSLLEYFPKAPPLSMEVNNWMYASAFVGAGLLLCAFSRSMATRTLISSEMHTRCYVFGAILSLVPVVGIVVGGAGVISTLSPVFGRLMNTIIECRPMKLDQMLNTLPIVLLAGVGAAFIWSRRKDEPADALAGCIIFACTVFFSLLYARFEPCAIIGSWVVLAFIARDARVSGRPGSKAVALFAGFLLLISAMTAFGQYKTLVMFAGRGWLELRLGERDLSQKILSDFRRNGSGELVIVAPPDLSTVFAYHTGAKTVCRIYWEVIPGLERYVIANASKDPNEMIALLAASKASYIMMPANGAAMDNLLYTLYGAAAYAKDFDSNMTILGSPDTRPSWLAPVPGIGDVNGKLLLPGHDYYFFRVKQQELPAASQKF